MNPYLEQDDAWHDFHERFCPRIADALTPQVSPHYIVKIDENPYIHELPADQRRLLGRGDVFLSRPLTSSAPVAVAEPHAPPTLVGLPAVDMEGLSFVEIRDRRSRELVTVLELLSPSNKEPGPDREQYLAKRMKLLRSATHFVEIDLLRGGPRLPFEDLPDCDYYVIVSRAEQRPEAGLWPLRLRDRLPEIRIPLRSPHEDARLDLQHVLNEIYDAAGYRHYIYEGEPEPHLSSEDQAWVAHLLTSGAPR
jgi:hypothetical protein